MKTIIIAKNSFLEATTFPSFSKGYFHIRKIGAKKEYCVKCDVFQPLPFKKGVYKIGAIAVVL